MDALPGAELIAKGLTDLREGSLTLESLLVSIGYTKLQSLGLEVTGSPFTAPEHRLYLLLAAQDPERAHSQYNAYIRRLVSFERALACAR